MENKTFPKGEIIIYKSAKGPEFEVKLEKDSVWLTQNQIALLFGTQRPAITKHLKNIFKSRELNEKSASSILEHTASDGKTYSTKFYNLDMIISIGYRVNSLQATNFRIWATKTLKQHLIKGYTINEKRLLKQTEKLTELQKAISFLQSKSKNLLLKGHSEEVLELLSGYSKSLSLLEQYDSKRLKIPKGKKAGFKLLYSHTKDIVMHLKKDLVSKKEASDYFGKESEHKFEGIINSIYQTFNGKDLYISIEEKAANLLYLTIKDHPYVDGNKRIASFLFIYFLNRNNYLYKENREKKINDNALVALALLMAVSDPKEKETMVKIVINLLKE